VTFWAKTAVRYGGRIGVGGQSNIQDRKWRGKGVNKAAMVRSGRRRKRCVYCGSEEPLTVEHVVPISRWREFGVKRRVLDNKSNRVAACATCNAEKGAMSPKRWFEIHPEYKDRFEREAKYLSNAVKRIAGLE
jgi:5-methylcytosine-specific restriction endonuclease McrA